MKFIKTTVRNVQTAGELMHFFGRRKRWWLFPILITLFLAKFSQGAWVAVLVAGLLAACGFWVRDHYLRFDKAMDKAADNFNQIKPPSDAKDAHAKIVDGLHKIAGTFHTAAKDAKGNDLTKVLTEVQGITDGAGAKEIQAAQDELVKNGYKVNN